jgi:hypothetical protein
MIFARPGILTPAVQWVADLGSPVAGMMCVAVTELFCKSRQPCWPSHDGHDARLRTAATKTLFQDVVVQPP